MGDGLGPIRRFPVTYEGQFSTCSGLGFTLGGQLLAMFVLVGVFVGCASLYLMTTVGLGSGTCVHTCMCSI